MPGSTAPVATRVMTRCPRADKPVFTGHRMRPAEREAVADQRAFRCAACGEVHRWSAETAWCEDRPRI